jgi:fatty acid desaturase
VTREPLPIPGSLNIALAVGVLGANAALLWAASHATSWTGLLLAAAAFSFANNTAYSLLHECVHRKFHDVPAINTWFGRVLAATLPTGLTFHRQCHLGHHQRNRSELERFDYYTPDDNKVLKYLQWYGILTGLYWFLPPLGCLLVLLVPRRLLLAAVSSRGSTVAAHTSAEAMLDGVQDAPFARMRLEILFSLAVQAAAWVALDLTLAGWAACYAAFALNWSALQYADHAWSELDVRDGAWNLKVGRVMQYVFLNYHHHRAHHQHPEVPWVHLGKYVDFTQFRPSFAAIYLSMWKGPRPLPPDDFTTPAASSR